jgi:hypothetical protein
MTRRLSLALLLLAAAALGPPALTAADKDAGGEELFNGKNLDGWDTFLDPNAKGAKPEDVWKVEDGVIKCKGKPNGYLITKKDYGNYILELEWRWPDKPGNSGVFVHVSGDNKIWPKGAEAQLHSGSAGDFWLVDNFKLTVDKERQDPRQARHYFRVGKDKKVEKPVGEWNKYRITCKGDTIALEINGEKVNEGTSAEASKGKIILQSEGAPIEFRNIKLTPIRSGE